MRRKLSEFNKAVDKGEELPEPVEELQEFLATGKLTGEMAELEKMCNTIHLGRMSSGSNKSSGFKECGTVSKPSRVSLPEEAPSPQLGDPGQFTPDQLHQVIPTNPYHIYPLIDVCNVKVVGTCRWL